MYMYTMFLKTSANCLCLCLTVDPALCTVLQYPSSIEDEAAAVTGDAYAVVDKPERKTKKQAGAPVVVPEKTEEELACKSRKQKSEGVSLKWDFTSVQLSLALRPMSSLKPIVMLHSKAFQCM